MVQKDESGQPLRQIREVEYYSAWMEETHICRCGWQGPGKELDWSEMDSMGLEYFCPSCLEDLLFVKFPSIDEAMKHRDELPPLDREMLDSIRANRDRIDKRVMIPDELPDIDDSRFVLDWFVTSDHRVEIRHGDRIIMTEPSWYESAERFVEVARILKQKYGNRVCDLRPSESSWTEIVGGPLFYNKYIAIRYVPAFRSLAYC